jgi:hypothetical protein
LAETVRYSGFQALARQHWRKEATELRRSFSKKASLKSLLPLLPLITLRLFALGEQAQRGKRDLW